MTAKVLISVLLALILVGGGIWLLQSEPDQNQTGTADTTPTETAPMDNDAVPSETTMEGTASMQELIARGEALTCTFSFTEDSTSVDGTGYFASDERMRMESTITQDGETYEVDYIIRDDTMYMWGETAQGTFGMQMALSDTESTTSNEEVPIEMDDAVTYSCSNWSVDESLFVLPTGIEFMDMNAMMPGGTGMTPEQMEALQEQYMQ